MITQEKKQEILDRLKGRNIRKLCLEAGVKRNTFYAVLNNESKRFEVIEAVIAKAEEDRLKTQETINSL